MREPFDGVWPTVDDAAFVHDRAVIVGRVTVGARSTIWPNVTLRGDVGPISIGDDTSIQDNSVGHTTTGRSVLTVGSRVTVGHSVILHGCAIGDDCLVGMGSIVLDNAVIAPWTLIGAGSLVPPNKTYPPGMLVLGRPAQVVRPLTDGERRQIIEAAQGYAELGAKYRAENQR